VGRNEQQARTQLLMRALMTSSGVRIADFARRNDFNPRTVRRDLESLVAGGYPIAEAEPGRYQLDPKSTRLAPIPPLLPDELLAIGAARENASEWRKTKLGRALDSAWCKLSMNHSAATTAPAAAPPSVPAALSFGEHLGINYDRFHRTIETIEAAIAKRVAISCRYRRIRGGEESERIIEPGVLHVDPALDSLYLIAYCRLRNDIRVFAVHRFLSAHTIDSKITARPALADATALDGAFHIWRDKTVSQIHLRFFGDDTAHVAERTIHKSQRTQWLTPPNTPSADTVLDIFFEVAGTQELLHWLLSYGAAVQVISPPSLIHAHHRQLTGALARYPVLPPQPTESASDFVTEQNPGDPPDLFRDQTERDRSSTSVAPTSGKKNAQPLSPVTPVVTRGK